MSEKAEALTHSLASLAARYAAASRSNRGALKAQLLDLAAERRTALLDLIDDAPGEVLKAELPSRVIGRLPAEVRDLLEYRGTIEGALQVVQIDHEDPGKSYLEFGLVTVYGERVSLHFAGPPTHRLTGEQVIAHGLILEGEAETAMVLESGEDDLKVAYCCDSSTDSTSEPELPNTLGAQSTAVLLVNFADDLSQPWTVAEAQDMVFGQVSDWFYEASHNQTWLEGAVYGWLTMDLSTGTCNIREVVAAAEQAASDAGIDLSPYDRRLFFTPRDTNCKFAGVAEIGGVNAWMNGYLDLQVTTHEVGHNFGLWHAHAYDCGDVSLGDDCANLLYGDTTDTMGLTDAGHYNAFFKQRLGWVVEGTAEEIEAVTSDGVYVVEPHETVPGSEPKALKIPAGVDSVTGKQKWLYVSYRQAIGFDSFYDERSYKNECRGDVTEGVYVHLATDGDPDSSFLLHMKPQSCFVELLGTLDWLDPALAVGDSFTEPETGNAITLESVSPSGASVFVTMGGSTSCVPADPQISVTALGDGWGAPGETESYDVTVTNADGSACDPATFDLSAAAPDGWTASFLASALTLSPGESGSTTLDLTSASNAADGTYDVPVTAANGANSASAMATYVVSASMENNEPVAVDDDASTDSKTSVTIPVMANDYDPDGDSLTVIAVTQPKKGTVDLNADGTITYTPGKKAKGSDSFDYTISDGADGASAVVGVSFTTNDGGGGGNNGKGPNK